MRRDLRDYVSDILNSMMEIQEFTAGMDFKSFSSDRKTINAVVRSLEVMGEAAKRIPDDVREKYQEIPWKYMTGMRDKLIYEYSGVDLEIVWVVIQEEIPPLRPQIKRLRDDLDKFS